MGGAIRLRDPVGSFASLRMTARKARSEESPIRADSMTGLGGPCATCYARRA
jgi:hypothetical protein